jgi:hypothetical protein
MTNLERRINFKIKTYISIFVLTASSFIPYIARAEQNGNSRDAAIKSNFSKNLLSSKNKCFNKIAYGAISDSKQNKKTLDLDNNQGSVAATSGSLIYLGTVSGVDIYQDPSTYLIIIFVSGLKLVYDTISSAINFIASRVFTSSVAKRCEFQGEYSSPNSDMKTCAYKCKGYGALATFAWKKSLKCPPSFDGNFPGP